MKICVFRFPSGFWGVQCRLSPGTWHLFADSCISKDEAINKSREASRILPSGRLYGGRERRR